MYRDVVMIEKLILYLSKVKVFTEYITKSPQEINISLPLKLYSCPVDMKPMLQFTKKVMKLKSKMKKKRLMIG